MRTLLILLAAFGLIATPTLARSKKPAPSHGASTARGKGSGSKAAGSKKAKATRGGAKASRGRSGSRVVSRGNRSSRRAHIVTAPVETGAGVASDDVGAQPETVSTNPDVAAEQARAAVARGDNAEALSRYLHVLSRRPDDLSSLIGAGRSALGVGDLNAATGFFAHAQDIAPADGRVEAGLGAVAVQNNDPREALRHLRAAEIHGVPAADLASDRALAYDLRGDPRRAQAEYATALRAKPGNAALLRRLALSQAIAGDRFAALNTLDPLLRLQDVAAWRTRAFVRAITGDLAGAEQDATAVVPAYQLERLKPYLARLAALRPAEKAAAVNLGRFPQPGARPSLQTAGDVPATAAAPRLSFDQSVASAPAASPSVAATPRTVPARAGLTAGQSAVPATPVRIAQAPLVSPAADTIGRAAGIARPLVTLAPSPPVISPTAVTPAIPIVAAAVASSVVPVPERGPELVVTRLPTPTIDQPAIGTPEPAPTRIASAPPAVMRTMSTPIVHGPPAKAATTAVPDPVVTKAQARATALAAQKDKERKAAAAKEAADKAAEKALAKANPPRSWVQIAGGANRADLPKAWAALKKKWPSQLSGRSPWTMHYRFTNRLLIGPFPSSGAAQAWVSDQKKDGLATFRVDTDAGEPVERLGG